MTLFAITSTEGFRSSLYALYLVHGSRWDVFCSAWASGNIVESYLKVHGDFRKGGNELPSKGKAETLLKLQRGLKKEI